MMRRPHTSGQPQQPITQRASAQSRYAQTNYDISDDDAMYDTRLPTSTRRYRPASTDEQEPTTPQQRALIRQGTRNVTKYQQPSRSMVKFKGHYRPDDPDLPINQARRSAAAPTREEADRPRVHWLLYVGLALLAMVIGWIIFTSVTSWWSIALDDWHYGRPRTYQIDAVVGHDDSASSPSHFIALNLRRHLDIIECPGGDCSKAKVYVGPVLIGQGQDLAPVTLSFKDVNGDGKPDMIITVQDSRFVFLNDHGQFREQRPNEQVRL